MKPVIKRKIIIRFLAILSMLIFFLPFYQACSDEQIKSGKSFLKTYSKAKTEQEKEIAFQETKKDFSLSGYDLAMMFEPAFAGFTIIMILNITQVVCFFRNHYNQLLLCFISLLIIFSTIVIMAFALLSFGQIRYGMYLCLLNSLLLFYLVYKEKENSI